MKNEKIGLSGILNIKVVRNGEEVDSRSIKNLIVTSGKSESARLIGSGLSGVAFGYLGYGTGTTPAAAGDTSLGTEVSRGAATVSNTTTTVTNDSVKFEATFSISGTYAVSEAGIFNAASAGDMLARQVFSVLNLVSGDSLSIEWTVQIS